jgi:hypothetical protein
MRLGTIAVALLAACGSFAHADSKLLDQEYAPLKKKAPVYHHVSQFNGIEGYCIVEYTVTAQGTTQDVFPWGAALLDCSRGSVSRRSNSSLINLELPTQWPECRRCSEQIYI